MSHINNTSFERISEEAYGNAPSPLNDVDQLSELGLDAFFADPFLSELPIAGVCDYITFTESVTNSVEPNELDGYLGPLKYQSRPSECDNSRALMDSLPAQTAEKEKKVRLITKQIPLSQSVGVGLPHKTINASHKVQIVHPLEKFFRARYKSDYFAQNGKSRKPRYVADRIGNHFVTLRVPVGLRGTIRVDWLTVADKTGNRYSMPYRFQQSNESAEVADCNPIKLHINADQNGIMKLYLVLIKSKQDELKSLQPLKPFHPYQDMFGIPDKNNMEQTHPLNPKQLIQKYQLDQSQLAFTFCALGSDGQTIPQWDTTVYSTILTEMPPENVKQKAIACPRCTHLFHIPVAGGHSEQDSVQETVSNKRKTHQNVLERPIKKQNSFENGFDFLNSLPN